VSPSDTQQTDTYYIVAHFHYVLFGGAIFGIFAGLYYWWPKIFGKLLDERLGSWNFWLMFVGMNLTFGPMHILGLQGQPRRMVVWDPKLTGEGLFDWTFWNMVASAGSYILGLGVLVFFWNAFRTHRKGVAAPLDPWDARSLEWMTSNPPKEHNFDSIPTVHALDEFFHRKYEEVDTDTGTRMVKTKSAEEVLEELESAKDHHIHMPSPSYWPIIVAFALPIMAYGIIYNRLLAVVGGTVLLYGLFGWAIEPSVAEDNDFDAPNAYGNGPKPKELPSG
jgi:cytochrome c oxidase subunit 1